MLVLHRKKGESITIDGLIKIKIIKDGKRISIGIDAPKHIQIVKDEVAPLKKNNHLQSA